MIRWLRDDWKRFAGVGLLGALAVGGFLGYMWLKDETR